MLEDFEKHIESEFSFLKNRSLLLAVSGGIDSVVLLHLFHKFHKKLSIAHCNFQLRGEESDQDAAFVSRLGASLNIPVASVKFDTKTHASEKKISIQMAARALRYDWFEKTRKKQGIDFVLTAHHREDALETFLINFSRGTGLEGLLGIPKINKTTVRPLLEFTREEIHAYAHEHQIKWREDRSNQSTQYTRNKIRHELIPLLRELNPNLTSSFAKTIANLRQSKQLLDEQVQKTGEKILVKDPSGLVKMPVDKIKSLKFPKAYLYEWLKHHGFGNNSEDLKEILDAQTGKQLFSKTHRLLKNRNELILAPLEPSEQESVSFSQETSQIEFPICLKLNAVTKIGQLNKEIAYLDKEQLKGDLTLRKWQKGDVFYPAGMTGKKKVNKYFRDEKLSLLDKEKTWLLCNQDAVVWIVGKRIDNRFIATQKSNRILKVEHRSTG